MARSLDACYDIAFLRAITGYNSTWYTELGDYYACNICKLEVERIGGFDYEAHGIAHIAEHPESWNLYVLLLDWGWRANYEAAKYALEQCRGK